MTTVTIEITVRLPEGWAKVSCPIGLSPGSLKKLSELFDQVLAESRRLSLPDQHAGCAHYGPADEAPAIYGVHTDHQNGY